MIDLEPSNQTKLFGLDSHLLELIRLYKSNKYPNKLLLSGSKGIGKSTLAYHLINYVLSEEEDHKYDIKNFKINTESIIFKTILNKSNMNLITIDVNPDKKSIDITQIRELIINLNKKCSNTFCVDAAISNCFCLISLTSNFFLVSNKSNIFSEKS